MQPHISPEQILSVSINGITITPELARHYTAKRNGHRLLLRVTANRQVLAYLGSSIYLPANEFNPKTKQALRDRENEVLQVLMSRAVKLVASTRQPDELKSLWDKELADHDKESISAILEIVNEVDEHQQLVDRAAQLEAELVLIYARIKELEQEKTYLAPAAPAATLNQRTDYAAALAAFLAEQETTLSVRDFRMWATWAKVLAETADANGLTLTLFAFDMGFFNRYKHHLMTVRGNKLNTFGAHVKRLKRFLKWAEASGYEVGKGHKHHNFVIEEEGKAIVYLNDEELNRIWDYRLIQPAYTKIIHLCLFQSLTGLRISDVTKSNIQLSKGEAPTAKYLAAKRHYISSVKNKGVSMKYLTGTCIKTGGSYKIPLSLDNRIEEILILNEFCLDIVSEAHYNREIKNLVAEVYQHHGEAMPSATITREDASGNKYSIQVEKNSELTTHSNRRSFVSRHINSTEFNHTDVMAMLGSTDMKEIQKYMDIDDGALHAKAAANSLTRRRG